MALAKCPELLLILPRWAFWKQPGNLHFSELSRRLQCTATEKAWPGLSFLPSTYFQGSSCQSQKQVMRPSQVCCSQKGSERFTLSSEISEQSNPAELA